jgi:hypothetical protein
MFGIGNWPELVRVIVNKLGIKFSSSDSLICVILEAKVIMKILVKCKLKFHN